MGAELRDDRGNSACLALLEFTRTDNDQWMLEKYAYRSPAQLRRGITESWVRG